MIYPFMHGGPSHIDLFAPKPKLQKYAGQPLPECFGKVQLRRLEVPFVPNAGWTTNAIDHRTADAQTTQIRVFFDGLIIVGRARTGHVGTGVGAASLRMLSPRIGPPANR